MSAKKSSAAFAIAAILAVLYAVPGVSESLDNGLTAARFDAAEKLQRPDNLDEWIFLGAVVGHGYPNSEERQFSADSPGMIQVVQMEPAAYRYLKQHGKYADGTMLALSFYNTQQKPQPEVDGIVQGELASFEIHLLDKQKFTDRSAFYVFPNDKDAIAMIPAGNNCVSCHKEDGAYDATFAQFYPQLCDRLLAGALHAAAK
ncbi:cytochrome P460 family protein [Microbulbifer hainanensis]|uniref:cytochrome P460 family protein n=1 Tax=Microbulbifer hainanensis TaxID=2735675 RepID=UPI00186732A0|nr:cytochrome P460 family protein [Microbulbifer hainanensis]